MTEEFPIFVPFGHERLAAIVTVPEACPQAAVVLLQGLGAPRSHAYQLWTRTARSLAGNGLASVRMDYPELGDSTGVLRGDLRDPPVEEVKAVIEVALDALQTDRFGVVGNCLGARIALLLASGMDSCRSAACIAPSSPKTFLMGGGKVAAHRVAGRVAKRVPGVARRVRRLVHSERIQPRMRFIPEVTDAMESADLVFLYLGTEGAAWRLRTAVEALRLEVDTPRRA